MDLNGAADRLTQLTPIKRALFELEEMSAKLHALEKERTEPIAIIGMGCRFPGGANSPETYWQLLRAGVDAVTEVPPDRWNSSAFYDADPFAPGKMSSRWGGFLENIDLFDPQFFGISPREATDLDPQHRLLLEVAWEALEYGGQAADKVAGTFTGVFVGISNFDYGQLLMNQDPAEMSAYLASGITHSTCAGRLSYALGLRGPSLAVDTACSSSLVAIHLAIQSLRINECEMALAGGVNVVLTPELLIGLSKAQMMASNGRCKTFDASADGFVRAEGCGMLVLKRLSDAQANGDHILAVIRGSAINQDGRSNGLTAPNGPAQEDVIRKALANGGVDPLDVGYVEAHGTGTSLGDPIEVHALGDVLCQGRSQETPLLIGSAKTNLGHLEAAAGVASVIKVVLALQHGEIPAHLHFEEPNPHIAWEDLAVDVPTKPTPFPGTRGRNIAGVSAFGFSGTNAHMVLERVSDTDMPSVEVERPLHLLTLSAKDDNALRDLAARYQHFLALEATAFADICFSANVGRAQFSQRLALVAASGKEAAAQLKAFGEGEQASGMVTGTVLSVEAAKPVFLFTGQGSQYVGMGKELYETQPHFRQVLDECDQLLRPYLEHSLLSVLFGQDEQTKGLLDQTAYTQPALFAVEYALAQLWQSWGVKPAAVMGHSVGEYVAACVAGMMTLGDGLKLIAQRGQLMQSLPSGGGMAALFAAAEQVELLLNGYEDSLAIAAYNGPANTVVSGEQSALDALLAEAAKQGIKSQRLTVSHAFHSPLMDSILAEFEKVAQEVTYHAPQVPLYSNLTGTRSSGIDAAYWRDHLRQPVRFAKAIDELHSQGQTLYLEVGPSPTLLGMARRCLPDEAKVSMLPSLRSGRAEWQQLLESLASLYVQGVEIDWQRFDQPYARRKVHLPTYPFQRQRYWVERKVRRLVLQRPGGSAHPLLGQPLKLAGNQVIFETEVSIEAFPFLAGHQMHGVPVFSAAGYIEMALAAGRAVLKARMPAVDDLTMHKALALSEGGPRVVQVVLAPAVTTAGSMSAYSFQIFSLATNEETGDEWELHVSGRLYDEPNGARQPNILMPEVVQARCNEQLSGENGLHLLQGVEQLWRSESEAIALIALPDSLQAEASRYCLHPALLDASLRMFGAVLAQGNGRFVPISVARVGLFSKPSQRLWCHLVIGDNETSTAQARTGDITLYDLTGQPIAQLEGLLVKRVAQEDTAPRVEWLYQLEWQPQPLAEQSAAASLLTSGQISPQLTSTLAQLQQEREWAQVQAIVPALEDLSTDYFVEALRQLGWRYQPGESLTVDSLAESMDVIPQQRRMFERMIAILAQDGIVKRNGQSLVVSKALEARDPQAKQRALVAAYPAFKTELTIASRFGEQWAAVLQGQQDPLALLFAGGSLAEAESMYQRSPLLRTPNLLAAAAVKAAISGLAENNTLRMLEIGAGTGGTTVHVLPNLKPEQTHYTFTDVSPLFVDRGQTSFSQVPFMSFRALDIEADPEAQGFAAGQFDLILAANVLHATADLRRTLGHVRGLLAPGGLLLLVEGTKPQRFKDLMVGLLEGWWKFTDFELRRDYALIAQGEWLALLKEFGFVEGAAIPNGQDGESDKLVEAVILATAPQLEQIDEAAFATVISAEEQKGRWLLFCDQGSVGQALAKRLQQEQQPVSLVYPGEEYQRIGEHDFRLDPKEPEHFLRLMQDAISDGEHYRAVVHLWALDAVLSDEVTDAQLLSQQQRVMGSTLHLAQAMAAQEGSTKASLWIATQQAQHVTDMQSQHQPSQATLWGLGRVIALAYPAIWGGLVDLDTQLDAQDEVSAGNLLAEIRQAGSGGEDQVAWRAENRYVARLVRSTNQLSQVALWNQEGTYLITGGLGSVGQKVARWLAQQGVRHLVLTSRTGLPDRRQWSSLDLNSADAQRVATVKAIEALGATVVVAKVDAGNFSEMSSLFAQFGKELPKLRGLFHTAAAGEPSSLDELTLAKVEEMFHAKGLGSWLLHQLTKELDLDYFVLFSSTTALLGAGDLAHYAAANCFLDSLAAYRHAAGLPTLSINWGTWGEQDGATNEQTSFVRFGLEPMEPDEALALLGQIVPTDCVQQTVAAVDWSRLRSVYEVQRARPFLSQLSRTTVIKADAISDTEPAHETQAPIRQRLEEALPDDRHEVVLDFVRGEVAKVLGHRAPSRLNVQQGLFDMGLDSLMAVELRSHLEASTGQRLPSTLTFNYPNIQALTTYLEESVFVIEPPQKAAHAPSTTGESTGDMNGDGASIVAEELPLAADEFEEISDQELLSLIDSELAAIVDLVTGDSND